MIPRNLHHVWLGPRKVPEDWATTWREMHPDWEQRIWREADLERIDMPNRAAYDAFLAAGSWHGASDIARVAILLAEGGLYVDLDSRPLRSFEGAPFMAADFVAGYEPTPSLPGRIANGTIGAVAGHPILRTYAELVGKMDDLSEPWQTCGGTGLTAAVLVHLACCKPRIEPARTFYATDAHGKLTAGSGTAYSEHWWATTNALYPVRTVICVPRRAGDPVRDRAWDYVREHWSDLGWPIVEGHHDDGPFNASSARNRAAREAGDWEVAVFVDGDTVMLDHEPVRHAVRLAARSGHFVRPYKVYWIMDEAQSEALMATGTAPQGRRGRPLRNGAHGGVNVIPRTLWDTIGGYDERFVGWGSEDTAIELAATRLGGFTRLAGDVYHLWHAIGADRNTSLPGFKANVELRHRYEAAKKPAAMRALLDERDGRRSSPSSPSIAAVVITDGRKAQISQTIPSLVEAAGPFDEKLIVDDSGDPAYAAWLHETFPDWEVDAHRRLGHGPAMAYAVRAASRLDSEWILWCEDDLTFERPVDLAAMERVMDAEPRLRQMVLRRQAWFPAEVEAGPTMTDRFAASDFIEHDGDSPWLEHRLFFSLQPHLIRRSTLRRTRWPAVKNSEHVYSRSLFRDPNVICGIWGRMADAPWVTHSGERAGIGY